MSSLRSVVICLLLFGALIQKCYTSPICLFYTCVKLTGFRQAFYEFYQGIKKCIGICEAMFKVFIDCSLK
ncbi:hypothetical protein ES705_05913 [subsurface metagenome]